MSCSIVSRIFFSEFPDIPEKSWRRRRWRKLANAKRFALQVNAVTVKTSQNIKTWSE